MTRILKVAALGTAIAAAAFGFAHAAESKPEDVLKFRQGIMQAIKVNFGPIGAVVKGEAPYSEDTANRAANLAALAKIAPQTYAKGTETIPNSKTKGDAWTKPEFAARFEAFQIETAKLAQVAKANDAEALKAQFGAVAKTCKGCHDNFKEE